MRLSAYRVALVMLACMSEVALAANPDGGIAAPKLAISQRQNASAGPFWGSELSNVKTIGKHKNLRLSGWGSLNLAESILIR